MGVENIAAWLWECDVCGRHRVMPGDDEDPPYGWISEGMLAFCGHTHYMEFLREQERLADS